MPESAKTAMPVANGEKREREKEWLKREKGILVPGQTTIV